MSARQAGRPIAVRALLGIWILVATAAARERPTVEAGWAELPPLLEGREIETVLLDGVRVKGKVIKVAADSIRMKVSKSSDPRQPGGERQIRRELFSLIRVKLTRGPARALLAISGIAGALAIANAKYNPLPEGFSMAGFVFTMYGLPVALGALGYHLGARVDDKSFDVRIIPPGCPEPRSSEECTPAAETGLGGFQLPDNKRGMSHDEGT